MCVSGHKRKIACCSPGRAELFQSRARQPPLSRNALHAAGLLENGSGGRSSSVRVRNAVDGSLQQGGLHDSCTRDLGRKDGQAACSSGALGRTGCVRALATKPPDNGDPTPTPEPEYGLGPPEGLLRNVGQVIFMDKPAAGSLALLGLTIGDPYLAGLGFAGGATATVTARAVGFDEEATDNGLMGYNGVLVGCAFSQFLAVSPPVALAATVAGAAATAPLAAVLKPLCGKVPQWTLAFNAATLSALLYTRPLPMRSRDRPRPSTRTTSY